ncbi:MAG: hypothetical protein ACTIIH_04350 [Brevibacterium sp.]|uniref:hypothetical protein n=1 Tax=Brevibacterium sp. TaxID=1701 RepID=UPI003F917D46
MTKLDRPLICSGRCYTITAALSRDGQRCPASNFLEGLKKGLLKADPDHQAEDGWPDERQVNAHVILLSRINHFSNHGEPQSKLHINALRDGIWEFKSASKRVSFFDTDGQGGYCPKEKYKDRDDAPEDFAQTEFWWVPNFDEDIRLGHSFFKRGEKTEEHDIRQCKRIREGDLSHDAPDAQYKTRCSPSA